MKNRIKVLIASIIMGLIAAVGIQAPAQAASHIHYSSWSNHWGWLEIQCSNGNNYMLTAVPAESYNYCSNVVRIRANSAWGPGYATLHVFAGNGVWHNKGTAWFATTSFGYANVRTRLW